MTDSIQLDRCVTLLQSLIQTPSLPGQEGDIAALVAAEMRDLGYEEVRIDEVGNVLGKIHGQGSAPPLMFNTHLDHVDVGDPSVWPHPPFGGEIHDDRVWGRGAVDIKGPMAAQIHGAAQLLEGERPPGDVLVTCVVQEEIGGVGARHLAEQLQVPVVVVGEPSRNTVRRGHRGRTELMVHVIGRSVHASVPQEGVNPLTSLGHFLAGLDSIEMPEDPDLGPSSVTATLLKTDQTSANVVPGEVWQTCDWRNVPGQTGEDAQATLQELADRSVRDGAEAEVTIPVFDRRTYTGLDRPIPGSNPAYILPSDHPAVVATSAICDEILGEERPVGIWKFATDGGHFATAGMAPIGFGPGDEMLAHTLDEHIEIAALGDAIRVNAALARRLAAESSH
jgi:putative selenium metabolism hydrolase